MGAITFFIIDYLPLIIMAAALIYCLVIKLRLQKRPQYWPDQEVLGQNYRTRNGDFERCRVNSVRTVWLDATTWYHLYECEVIGEKKIALELREDRIKPIRK